MKKKRYSHNTVKTRLRHLDRYPQLRPRQDKPQRFTYIGVTVGGKKALSFLVDGKPLFKQPIVCTRDKALALVGKLNACTKLSEFGDGIIRDWLKSLEEVPAAASL